MMLISYQNCSSPVNFSAPSNNSVIGGPYPEDPEQDIDKSCAGSLYTAEQTIVFESTRDEHGYKPLVGNKGGRCDWGNNGNSDFDASINDNFRARIEEVQKINLPARAKVCDMEFDFKENNQFKYDDHMLITLNDRILMSTARAIVDGQGNNRHCGVSGYPSGQCINITGSFNHDGSGYIYEWNKLRNKSYSFQVTDIYCNSASMSDCQMPETTSGGGIDGGKMKLNIPKGTIQKIRVMTESSYPQFELKVITVGENDNGDFKNGKWPQDGQDCSHESIEIKVRTKYYLE